MCVCYRVTYAGQDPDREPYWCDGAHPGCVQSILECVTQQHVDPVAHTHSYVACQHTARQEWPGPRPAGRTCTAAVQPASVCMQPAVVQPLCKAPNNHTHTRPLGPLHGDLAVGEWVPSEFFLFCGCHSCLQADQGVAALGPQPCQGCEQSTDWVVHGVKAARFVVAASLRPPVVADLFRKAR